MERKFNLKKVTLADMCLKLLGNLIFVYTLVIAIALIIFSTATIECKVNGDSMKPTYNSIANTNDYVYVNKFNHDYNYGDVIVIYTDDDPIIKRVVGLPGDIIDIVYDSNLHVYRLERNGEIIIENYIYDNGYSYEVSAQNGMDKTYERFEDYKTKHPVLLNNENKLVIRDYEVFALGDNRRISSDSSERGAFEIDDIAGIVEIDRKFDENIFKFYYEYILNGGFIYTLINIF